MSVDAKQREWIWEFFLKNCKDARMIHELMNALPFPDDNLDIKRMLLLRSLSLQVATGIIDECTLDILRGLGEVSRVSGGSRRERRSADFSYQEASKRRKVSEDESHHHNETAVFVGATVSASPQAKEGMVPSWGSEQRRESSKDDARKAEPVVGIRDWMKGRALPRSVSGKQCQENDLNGSNMNMEGAHSSQAETPHGHGAREFVFRPGQFATQWELELAVMLEVAVKHLRGDSPDRNSFEQAVTKHWVDSAGDPEAWPESESQNMARARDHIKGELWMVRRNPQLLDGIVEKYTKSNVEDMLKIYLERAWAATGQTFLDRVSADVLNGKYKPVNSNGQRPKKAGSPLADGDAGQQSNPKVDTSEKPWIRASRGRYSRSREKLQKNFAVWDLDDNAEGGGAAPKPPTTSDGRDKHVAAEPQTGEGNPKKKATEGGEARPSLSTEGGFEINARSVRFDPSIARVLEFEEPDAGPQSEDGKQPRQEKQDTARADIEITEADGISDQAAGAASVSGAGDGPAVTVTRPTINAQDGTTAPGDSNVMNPPEDKGTPAPDNEAKASSREGTDGRGEGTDGRGEGTDGRGEGTDGRGEEPGSPPHEVVNKENVTPPSSPKRMDPNPAVCFSPPPWVEGAPAAHVAEGLTPGPGRKRKSGSIQDETPSATRREEGSRNAEATGTPTSCSNPSPGTVATRRNLRRKQMVLDAVVQDPLPKILTTRSKVNLLERNATARTVEWEEEDDIEQSQPNSSPSASRHVRLPRANAEKTFSPLVAAKTGGNMNAKRRKHRRWTDDEVATLRQEVGVYGKGRWKLILEKNPDTFQGRTEVDLKDKWRNLERFEGVTD